MIRTHGKHCDSLALAAALVVCVLIPAGTSGQTRMRESDLPRLSPKAATKLLLQQDPPDYPPVAKMNYIQGKVHLLAVVNSTGAVAEAHVVDGHPLLAAAALKAVRHWLFRPAKSRPGPPQFQTLLDVHFSLFTKKIDQFPSTPESDLRRQIHPPELVQESAGSRAGNTVRLRVLVGDDGHALDSSLLGSSTSHLEEARGIVEHWNFRPARWGTLHVPWYLDLDVPIDSWPTTAQGGADPDPH